MNRAIVRFFGLILVLYATLIGFTSYWSVFDAKGLRENVANRRPLLEQLRIHRGTIFARDGSVIAISSARGAGSRRTYERSYPQGLLWGNPVGYSFLSRGQVGVEKAHNDQLVGVKSEFSSILDQLQGQRQRGDDLVTSLDPAAQRAAVAQLAGRCGAVVALEPASGRVRAMVSVPEYDPNDVRVSPRFAAFNRNPLSPLFNRVTQSGYPPGSTFKVVTAVAAIDSGKFTPTSVLSGRSPITISGAPLSNFAGEQYGDVDLTTALTHSINTVWAQVGERIGQRTLFKYMRRFGFNSRPPLDYPSDQMRSSGAFDGRRLLTERDAVDVGRIAIGQERLEVTPMQMAMVASAVANRGRLMRPQLWDRLIDPDGRTVRRMKPSQQATVMSTRTAAAVAGMMANVVREGTGTAAALSGINVAGKTGTAQVGASPCGGGAGLSQAWFIGFAPVEAPRVAVAVTVERTTGQGGTIAAPIAARVMETILRGTG
jgi:penicillin-binding protein A